MGGAVRLSEWLSVVRRARLGRTVKGVAFALATRANNDGTGLFTGIARLSVEAEVSPKVMKTAMRTLREVGLIELVRASRGRGESNEYCLTIPEDGQINVPTPATHELEIARVADSLRGKWKSDDALRCRYYPAGDGDLRGSSDTAGEPEPEEPAGYLGDGSDPPAGYLRDNLRGSCDPATSPIPRQVTTTSPSSEDARTDLTVSRARGSQPEQISEAETPRLRLVHSSKANGFCLVCYADGRIVVAVDEINGDACKAHLRVVDGRAS